MSDKAPNKEPIQKTTERGCYFTKLARDQDDLPDPENFKEIISLKAHGATNVEKIESNDSVIFILSCTKDNHLVVSFFYSLQEEITSKPNEKEKSKLGRCLLFTANKDPPIPVTFDPEKLFSKKRIPES